MAQIDNLTLAFIARKFARTGIRVRRVYGHSYLDATGKPRRVMSHINLCAHCATDEGSAYDTVGAVMTFHLIRKGTKVMRCQRCKRLLHKRTMGDMTCQP